MPSRRTLALAALLAACSDSGPSDPHEPEPEPGDGALTVSPDSATLTAIGAELSLTVLQNGQTVAATLSVRSDSRWLEDRAVVNPATLGSGRVVAYGPGRAVVEVRAGNRTDSVIVRVAPSRPWVAALEGPQGRTHVGGPADTLVLRGYRMDGITAANVLVNGDAPTIVSADSASLRFTLPIMQPAECEGPAPNILLAFSGIDGLLPGNFTRRREGEVALSPGESIPLTAAQQACLRFEPATNAQYLLAWADDRLIEKAKSAPEFPWPDSVRVTVAPQLAGKPTFGMAALPTPPRAEDVRPASAAAIPPGCPLQNSFLVFCRTSPWVEGETFAYYPAATQRPQDLARVLFVRGNIVLAVFRPDSALIASNALAKGTIALDFMAQQAVPLLQSIFSTGSPATTSDESGQLLVTLESSPVAFASWFPDATNGHGRWGRVVLDLTPNSAFGSDLGDYSGPLLILSHEILHTYQFRWRWQRSVPWSTFLGTSWAVEGGASMFALEMVRQARGIPFLENTNLTGPASSAISLYFFRVDNFTEGYMDAASLLRDFTQRLVSAGLSFEDAMQEVLVGALEGWWGINEEGKALGPGLVARMRQHLGPGWDPVEALIVWTLSQTADDLTTNPEFQNLTVYTGSASTAQSMFPPHGVVEGSVTVTATKPAGTTGVFEIRDGSGGSYGAQATVGGTSASSVRWRLLRLR